MASGQRLIQKSELGTTTYVVVSGTVRVHDGDVELATLGEGEVVGELAALDPEPRSASVTALEDSLLLALENGPLLELIGARPEVTRGLFHFLARRVRQRASAPTARSCRAGAELAAGLDVDGARSGDRRIGLPG